MKLKYNFVINEVADKMVAVAIGGDLEKFNGFIKMNETGAEIFEILKNDVTEDEVVAILLEKHPDATKEEVTEIVNDFIGKLKESDILE